MNLRKEKIMQTLQKPKPPIDDVGKWENKKMKGNERIYSYHQQMKMDMKS